MVVQHHDLGRREELDIGLAGQQVDEQLGITAVRERGQRHSITTRAGGHRRVETQLVAAA